MISEPAQGIKVIPAAGKINIAEDGIDRCAGAKDVLRLRNFPDLNHLISSGSQKLRHLEAQEKFPFGNQDYRLLVSQPTHHAHPL